MPTSSPDENAERLADVRDDSASHEECRDWLIEEMQKGRSTDGLQSELVDNGWSAEEADHLVDVARRKTRSSRGVLGMRDDVARRHAPRRTTLYAPDEATAGGAGIILMIGRGIEWLISRKTREIRYRMQHGLCHCCGHDIKTSEHDCPQCQTPIIRRRL